MNFIIADALAQQPAPGAPAGGGWSSLIFLVGLFAIFYFLLIRPQTKRAKEHKAMVEALVKGDEVVTGGGLAGKVQELGDNFITVEISPNVAVKVQRHAVQAVLPKGTLKSL